MLADPTDRAIDPELPVEEEPVLMAKEPLTPSVLVPVASDTEPLTPLVLLSMATDPERALGLDPDCNVTEPPTASLSLAPSPASNLKAPPSFTLDPLSMVIVPPEIGPEPDVKNVSPPDPI